MFEVANGVENEYTIYANYIHTIDMYIRIVFIFLPKIRQTRSSNEIESDFLCGIIGIIHFMA